MKSSIENVKFLFEVSDKTLQYMSNKELSSLQALLWNLIERQRHSVLSLEVLLREYQREALHEHSIGVILRSSLLDAMIGANLYAFILENENETDEVLSEKLNELASAFLADGISISINQIESYLSHSMIDGNELRLFYNQIVKLHGEFFEPYGFDGSKPTMRKLGFDISPKSLYKKMVNEPRLKSMVSIYDKYMLYSKYDHQSVLYNQIFRQERKIKDERITESTVDLIMSSFVLHYILLQSLPSDEFISDQYKSIDMYVDKILISKSN